MWRWQKQSAGLIEWGEIMGSARIVFDKGCFVSYVNKDNNYPLLPVYERGSLSFSMILKTSDDCAEFKHNLITSASFSFSIKEVDSGLSGKETLYFKHLYKEVDLEEVTYNTLPMHDSPFGDVDIYNSTPSGYITTETYNFNVGEAIIKGLFVSAYYTKIYTAASQYPFYIDIEYGEKEGLTSVTLDYPVAGDEVPRSIPSTFSWKAKEPGTSLVIEKTKYERAIIRWRVPGSSTSHEVSVDKLQSYTFPANTFESGEIEWQVEAIANSGVSTFSIWQRVAIKDKISTASIVKPDDTVIDGSGISKFEWKHIIETGTPQTGYDIQVSTDNNSWSTIKSEKTENNFAYIGPNVLQGGDLYWRVRTYNADGAAGEWSESAKFIVFAASNAPIISFIDPSPMFSVRWQQSGQQAYEIMLNGSLIARDYSTGSNYKYTDYLDPGEYELSIRIQNKYGLWSDYGKISFTVSNDPGQPINLNASIDGHVVLLRWDSSEMYTLYLVYRDDILITRTTDTFYVDQFAIWDVKYMVRGVKSDNGYYTLSNEAHAFVHVPCITIADAKNPVWQKLKYSISSIRATGLSADHSVTYQHYAGKSLPSAEIGEAVNKSYSLDCAFAKNDLNSAQAFESLLGKLVCVKDPSGERYVGVMVSISKETSMFYRSYSASITLVHWEENLS